MTNEQTKGKGIARAYRKLGSLPASVEISKDISWRDVNGETIILNLKTGEYFTLNETGKFLWKGFSENKQPGEMVELLAGEYHVAAAEVAPDVLEFIEGLMNKDVFVPEV